MERCKRCGGKVLQFREEKSCINCGQVVQDNSRVFVRAVDPQVPAHVKPGIHMDFIR